MKLPDEGELTTEEKAWGKMMLTMMMAQSAVFESMFPNLNIGGVLAAIMTGGLAHEARGTRGVYVVSTSARDSIIEETEKENAQ